MHTFVEKVEMERRALTVVNASLGPPELHGLSRAAIGEWEAANRSARGAVAKKLLYVSELLSLLCERSGGRVNEEYAVVQSDVAIALSELSALVAKLADAADRDATDSGDIIRISS